MTRMTNWITSLGTEDGKPDRKAQNISRRRVLKKGTAATAGLFMLGTAPNPVQAQDTEQISVTPNPTEFFIPENLIRGDREFAGHGPDVDVKAELHVRNTNELWAKVAMSAKETVSDWTTVSGSEWYKVWDGQPNGIGQIVSINSDTSTSDKYRDTDHGYDTLSQGSGELVDKFVVRGDTKGEEAGTRTGVEVHFNPVQLTVRRGKCERQERHRPNPTQFFVPKNLKEGDREFAGHGPEVYVKAQIRIHNTNELRANVGMVAKETVSDWTTVTGSEGYKVWDGNNHGVKKIVRIESETLSEARYTDTDHGYDTLSQGSGDLVDKFVVRGDTKGEEAGTRTGVKVHFNPVRLAVRRC